MNDGWEQQPGGLYLAVIPFQRGMPGHDDAAITVMRDAIQKVAQVHGANFSGAGLKNNMHAIYKGDIQLDLYFAKWEVCDPAPLCLGAALNWHSVGIGPNGEARKAIYTEDVCLLNRQLRKLVQRRPEGADFPDEGLTECFERIGLQKMVAGHGAAYRFGEVNLDNTKMVRTLGGNGATLGNTNDSAVLEFKRFPNDLIDRLPMDVEVIGLRKQGKIDANNFIVSWRAENADLRFVATKGQATAVGQPRVDIRPWHNGVLPPKEILDAVTASSVLAIKREVDDRKWSVGPKTNIPSPVVPLNDIRSVSYRALHEACGRELSAKRSDRKVAFERPIQDAHVHIIQDQPMLEAFRGIGAETRLFGNRPMMPGINFLCSPA